MSDSELPINTIINADVIAGLKQLPDNSIDCIITSPPYWALRDYKTEGIIWDGKDNCEHDWNPIEARLMHQNRNNSRGPNSEVFANPKRANSDDKLGFTNICIKCNAWKGQLGQEPNLELFIKHLIAVFDQCKRILKKTGTCWVVLGDTYAGGNGNTSDYARGPNSCIPTSTKLTAPSGKPVSSKVKGIQNKSLLLIPHRFAIAMLDRGWILRNNIIWHKPNCMPSSAKDRFTVDYEHIFFFTKSKKYYFKTQYEPSLNPEDDIRETAYLGRIKRCVWKINTRPFPEAHFAVFPESLVKQCLDAGCPSEICRKCGKSPTPIYNITKINTRSGTSPKLDCKCRQENGNPYGTSFIKADYIKYRQQIIRTQNRIEKCNCDAGFDSGIVLDPFMGSGTTALVALKNNRQFIGIELNPDYVQMAYKRIDPYLKQTKLY